jgi:ubiquinone/menaquinone biosynthesis C-methylase UbiE
VRKEVYEGVAERFEQDHQLNGYHHFRRLEVILFFLKKLGNNLLVLDAGCGDGLQLEKYVRSNRAFGMDISLTRLERAKERLRENIFFSGDLFKLPLRENVFDVVILGEIIEHLEEPEVVLREVYRVLNPSGHIIMDTPSQSNMVDLILRLFRINPNWGYEVDKTHLWFFKMSQIVRLLKKAGYAQIKVKGAPFLRYNLPIIHHCTWVKRRWWAYRLFDFTLGNLPFLSRLGAIQVFMAKK